LDTAEFSAAFGIAYDWLYDIWQPEQKSKIISTLITYGLEPGIQAYTNATIYTGWWKSNGTLGNWNCVCNGGLTMASLAILEDDWSGLAKQLLGLTVDNAKQNCAMAPSDDGTWAEVSCFVACLTFSSFSFNRRPTTGTSVQQVGSFYHSIPSLIPWTAHAEMASSLMTATGSHYGLLDVNPNFANTGDFHMYVTVRQISNTRSTSRPDLHNTRGPHPSSIGAIMVSSFFSYTQFPDSN
jgi:hypothetical protein